jgi:hydrogenase-4 component B
MIIIFLIMSLSSFLAGSLILVFMPNRLRAVKVVGPLTTVTGSVFGILSAILSFISGPVESAGFALSIPSGSFALGMDSLSALFAVPVLFISSLCAVYSTGYLKPFELHGKDTSRFWSFFNLLAGSMLLVTVARNALLFLLGWEVMALSSFFLVMFEAAEGTVRKAGWTYLVATHLGTACLLVLFSMLSSGGSMDFADLAVPVDASVGAGAAFILAMLGFGVKAGFVPLHVWLPEAHPSAPSNVSAVMSGVMIKTGIYGLLRFLLFLGSPPAWWGWVLLLTGIVSGIAGVLFALAQHDLKRLLAYSSVENIGIITIGLGLGFLGISYNIPAMACLGFVGAILHVFNHAVFKSLLFMAAGSVLRETGSKQIDQLGGLLKRMPATGLSFFTGSAAISGFPPFNGFISELIIYLAAFSALTAGTASSAPLAGLLAAGALALIGGLALACFTKAFGIVFLGEPRSFQAQKARETAFSMRFSMWFLSAACLVLGLAGPFMLVFLWPVAGFLCNGFGYYPPGVSIPLFVDTLEMVTLVSVFVISGAIVLFSARSRLLSRRKVTTAPTWGCGYSSPSPSMQYTSSSFSDPIIKLFGALTGTLQIFREPKGLFPEKSSFASETPDVCQEKLYRPLFTRLEKLFGSLRMIQHGRVNLYILYIVAALFALLAWKLG